MASGAGVLLSSVAAVRREKQLLVQWGSDSSIKPLEMNTEMQHFPFVLSHISHSTGFNYSGTKWGKETVQLHLEQQFCFCWVCTAAIEEDPFLLCSVSRNLWWCSRLCRAQNRSSTLIRFSPSWKPAALSEWSSHAHMTGRMANKQAASLLKSHRWVENRPKSGLVRKTMQHPTALLKQNDADNVTDWTQRRIWALASEPLETRFLFPGFFTVFKQNLSQESSALDYVRR